MKILMFTIGFMIFLFYIIGYIMMIKWAHKPPTTRKTYQNHGMDKLDDFPGKIPHE